MARFGGDGPLILALGSVLCALAVLCIVLRAFVASRTNGKWRWDFIWVAASGLFGLGSTAAIDVAALYGLGNDVSKLTFPDIFAIVHWSYISIFLALVATTLVKWSLIAFLLQILPKTARKQTIALWLIGGLGALVNLVQLMLSLFQCSPVEKLWYRALPGSCPRIHFTEQFSVFQGAGSAFTDLVLALWPISIVYDLQTSLRVKVMVCSLTGLGMLPMIASVLRVSKVHGINESHNVTRAFGPFMLYIVIELWIIVILTSAPVLRPLFLKMFYGIKTSRASRSTNVNIATGGTKQDHITQPKSQPLALELDIVDNDSQTDDDTAGIFVSKSYQVSGQE